MRIKNKDAIDILSSVGNSIDRQTAAIENLIKKITLLQNMSIQKSNAIMYIAPEQRENARNLALENPDLYEYITEVLKLYFT